jgi:peptidoglycan/LPS O-acetylase OafA/YrhL
LFRAAFLRRPVTQPAKGEAGLSKRRRSSRFVLSRFALLPLSSLIPKVANDTTTTAIDPRFTDRKRQPGLDLLRAAAILVVTIYHAGIMGFPLPGRAHRFGWIGVDLFFVLSGYLIGGQLLGDGTPSSRDRAAPSLDPRRFFARRALRILPAYLVILAVYAFLPSGREYPEMSPLWKFVVSVQNIGLRGGTAFSHAWSLAVEDQFYLLLPLILLLVIRRPRAAMIVPCLIVIGGFGLRWLLALQNLDETGAVSFRGYQTWIYYATWGRLDPLVLGVVLAAIEKFRIHWWQRLTDLAPWFGLPALALIVYALWLGETDSITVTMSVWQFPLIALGMAALLLCAVSPRLPFRRIKIPGAAFIASVAYSAYLVQKLVIHFAAQFCAGHDIAPTSALTLLTVQMSIYLAATVLFLAVERPFLQLRHRLARRT